MRGVYCSGNLSKENGTTLLEVIVSIALASILLVAAGKLVLSSLNGYRLTKRRYGNDLTYLQLRHRFQQIMDDLDGHHFYLVPRVQLATELEFADGEALSFSKNLLPIEDSYAVTAIALDLKQTLDVAFQDGSVFTACERYGHVVASEHNFGYLGLSVDGMFEMQGSGRNRLGRSDCLDLNLRSEDGMLLESEKIRSQPLQVLIPIRAYYTLYVDKNEQLRYISHKGKEITENQPLFTNVKKLEIEPKELWGDINCLIVNIELSDNSKRDFTVCNRLGRIPSLNFILNRA